MRDRVPINKENIPYRANLILGASAFTVEVHYNSRMDSYVVHLFDGDELICGGERVVYGRQLWADVYKAGQYPVLRIVPLDESGTVDVVTKETFGELVFLTIDDGPMSGPDNEGQGASDAG